MSQRLQTVYLEEISVKGLMKTTIFVALGAVGITTAIMSSGIPVHAQQAVEKDWPYNVQIVVGLRS